MEAFYAAAQGKKNQSVVAWFNYNLSRTIFALQNELQQKNYCPGPYTTFYVYDPKKRLISAAPFRDRVVHHALCNIIEPIFERTFIYDSYANRLGKGTHAAIERFQYYARKYPYVLKCDIKKFFPSVDHAILKQEIRWKVACPDTLWLIDLIIDNSNAQEPHLVWFPGDDLLTPAVRRRGLPIGNLTSQFWANVYLNRFDHYIKEELQVPGYIRYVDDFVLFSHSKSDLIAWKSCLEKWLAALRLVPHPDKTHIHQTSKGVSFLGFKAWPDYRVPLKAKTRRFERHLTAVLSDKECSKKDLEATLNSWRGHIRFGQCRRLEYRVFRKVAASGFNIVLHPRNSWRIL